MASPALDPGAAAVALVKRWERDLGYIRLVGPDEPRFDAAVARVSAHISELERTMDELVDDRLALMKRYERVVEENERLRETWGDCEQELERVKAERDALTKALETPRQYDQLVSDVHTRLEKALAALREIVDRPYEGGAKKWWTPKDVRSFARAAIGEIEGEGGGVIPIETDWVWRAEKGEA